MCRLDVAGAIRVERRHLLRSVAELLVILGVIPIVVDRGNVVRATRRHLGERRVVEVDRMLDRLRAGAHRVASTLRAVGMNRDALAGRVRSVNRRLHLVEGECLVTGDVGAAPGRAVDLDPIGAGVDLRLHGNGNVGNVGDAPARRAGWRTRARRRPLT